MPITTNKKQEPVPAAVSDPEGINKFLPKAEFVRRRQAENKEKEDVAKFKADRNKKMETEKDKAIGELIRDVTNRLKECAKFEGEIKDLESIDAPEAKKKAENKVQQLRNCKIELEKLQDDLKTLKEGKGESSAVKKAREKVAAQKDISKRQASVAKKNK